MKCMLSVYRIRSNDRCAARRILSTPEGAVPAGRATCSLGYRRSRQSPIDGIFSHAIHGVNEVIVASTNGRGGWIVVTLRCINFF
jgi:hypothetical protein